jgi:hypothetical protein
MAAFKISNQYKKDENSNEERGSKDQIRQCLPISVFRPQGITNSKIQNHGSNAGTQCEAAAYFCDPDMGIDFPLLRLRELVCAIGQQVIMGKFECFHLEILSCSENNKPHLRGRGLIA